MSEQDFVRVYDEYADAIFRHCFFRVFDRQIALDLTQDVFYKTWEYVAGGREIAKIKPFLYRVATNLVIDHSRRKKELSLEELEERGFDPPDLRRSPVDEVVGAKLLAEKLRELPVLYREALAMRYIDDLSPREIAEITGESENVISVRVNRAVQKLRKLTNL